MKKKTPLKYALSKLLIQLTSRLDILMATAPLYTSRSTHGMAMRIANQPYHGTGFSLNVTPTVISIKISTSRDEQENYKIHSTDALTRKKTNILPQNYFPSK